MNVFLKKHSLMQDFIAQTSKGLHHLCFTR